MQIYMARKIILIVSLYGVCLCAYSVYLFAFSALEYLRISMFKFEVNDMFYAFFKDGSCNGLQHYAALGRDKVKISIWLGSHLHYHGICLYGESPFYIMVQLVAWFAGNL